MSVKPDAVIRIHQHLCPLCAGKAHDPCASCDHGKWGRYTFVGCNDPTRATSPARHSRTSTARPGDLLALLILRVTGQQSGNCACEQRQQQLNAWGWWQCYRNRTTVIGWLCEEAAKRGHPISADKALSLFKAALLEVRRVKASA
jgi:hypothetical protein